MPTDPRNYNHDHEPWLVGQVYFVFLSQPLFFSNSRVASDKDFDPLSVVGGYGLSRYPVRYIV